MATPPPSHASLDPVSVVTALAAALGLPLANVIGPYAVIVVAALTGGATALGRRAETTRIGATLFLARVVGTAVLLTAAAAELATVYWPSLAGYSQWLLAPIALVIGWIGDDWRGVLRWVTAWRRGGRQ